MQYHRKIFSTIIIIIINFSILFTINSCINFKSEYPQIQYYHLNQDQSKIKNIGKINGSLQVRAITLNEEFNYDNLLALWDSSYIQMYYYHRWIADAGSLVTDFIITRYNILSAFSNGVLNSSSITIPDYIMEGQIIDWTANSTSGKSDNQYSNNVSFTIRINISKRDSLGAIRSKIFDKVYSVRIPRPNSNVESIPPAFSAAVSHIVDMMLLDIQTAVATDQQISK